MANTQFENDLQTQTQPQQQSSNRGCLFGCLIAAGLVVGSLVCAGVGGYWFVSKQIAKYTSDTPLELPTVEYSEQQLAELEQRMESFGEVVDQSVAEDSGAKTASEDGVTAEDGVTSNAAAPPTELVLTAEEINAMICKNADLRGKIFVKIENDQVSGDVSFPLDQLPGGKGRYFNGSATFDVSMQNGRLVVILVDASVNGDPVPPDFVDAMAGENLAKDMYRDPKQRKILEKFESIKVEGDRVIMELKQESAKAPGVDVDQPADEQENTEASVETEPLQENTEASRT